ncbi:MAG: hypothetical protein MUC49_15760 [Raineya sp.]|nr:hypothetical protein [Raineya sp.]
MSPTRKVGLILILSLPIFHNLHIILPKALLDWKILYYDTFYYYIWLSQQSLAPCITLVGIYLARNRNFTVFAISYQFMKFLEKLPYKEEFDPHEDLFFTSLSLSILLVVLYRYSKKIAFKLSHIVRHATSKIRSILDLEVLTEEEKKEHINREIDIIEKEFNVLYEE